MNFPQMVQIINAITYQHNYQLSPKQNIMKCIKCHTLEYSRCDVQQQKMMILEYKHMTVDKITKDIPLPVKFILINNFVTNSSPNC